MHSLNLRGSAHLSRILILVTFCIVHSLSEAIEDQSAVYLNKIRSGETTKKRQNYNYDQQGKDWKGTCQNGQSQSPINLAYSKSIVKNVRPIRFYNYDEPLQSPLVLTNNGHTVSMVLPPTLNGQRAYIKGGFLPGSYEAHSVHFHWGSSKSKGSEHTINKKRYDVEMHIVHKNTRYAGRSWAEVNTFADGLAVLGVMFRIVPDLVTQHSGLLRIFDQLPRIIGYKMKTTVSGLLTTGQLLGNVSTNKFYSYNGSLTTPDCAESVIWTVFEDVVDLPRLQIRNLWDLRDSRRLPLKNNYRQIQNINNRTLYYTPLQ